jgi:anti-anti-sigma regulatory factor
MLAEVPFTIGDHAERPGWLLLTLTGRITVAHSRAFHQAALGLAAQQKNVMVSCHRAEHLDAAAIQVLLGLGRELTQQGKQCDVAGISGGLRDLFCLLGLEKTACHSGTAR